MDNPEYYLRSITRKLALLKSIKRLTIQDREIIAKIIDTDIPFLRKSIKDNADKPTKTPE